MKCEILGFGEFVFAQSSKMITYKFEHPQFFNYQGIPKMNLVIEPVMGRVPWRILIIFKKNI